MFFLVTILYNFTNTTFLNTLRSHNATPTEGCTLTDFCSIICLDICSACLVTTNMSMQCDKCKNLPVRQTSRGSPQPTKFAILPSIILFPCQTHPQKWLPSRHLRLFYAFLLGKANWPYSTWHETLSPLLPLYIIALVTGILYSIKITQTSLKI